MNKLVVALVGVASLAAADTPKVDPAKVEASRRLASFTGPVVAPDATGKFMWAFEPSNKDATWGDSVRLVKVPVGARTKSELITEAPTGDIGQEVGWALVAIPGALTAPAEVASSCKPGSAIAYACYVHHGVDRARLATTKEGCIASSYVTELVAKPLDGEKCSVIVLDGTAKLGAPIAYREGQVWHPGTFGSVGPTAKQAWIVNHGVHLVDEVVPLPVTPYKVGAKVWAARADTFEPGKITKVIANGAAYTIKFADGTDTVGFGLVSKPLP